MIWTSVIIPILCAIITGLFTLLGVMKTINENRQKDRIEYLHRIKPYVVLETSNSIGNDVSIKKIKISDDTIEHDTRFKAKTCFDVKFHFDSIMFSNLGNSVSIFEFIRINGEEYRPLQNECNRAIKPGETCKIIPHLSLIFVRHKLSKIEIGISDIERNTYIYNVEFTTQHIGSISDGENKHEQVNCNYIDCSSEISDIRQIPEPGMYPND